MPKQVLEGTVDHPEHIIMDGGRIDVYKEDDFLLFSNETDSKRFRFDISHNGVHVATIVSREITLYDGEVKVVGMRDTVSRENISMNPRQPFQNIPEEEGFYYQAPGTDSLESVDWRSSPGGIYIKTREEGTLANVSGFHIRTGERLVKIYTGEGTLVASAKPINASIEQTGILEVILDPQSGERVVQVYTDRHRVS